MNLFTPKYSNNIALIEESSKRVLTYNELNYKVDFLSGLLNLKKKYLAFIYCDNSIKSILYYLAVIESNGTALLLDSKLNNSMRSVLEENYKPDLIFSDLELPDHYYYKFIVEEYEFYIRKDVDNAKINNDLTVLLSTSGTTGSPKLVKLSSNNLKANAYSIVEYLDINQKERAITSLPMSYSYGLSIINSHLLAGASILLTEKNILFNDFWEAFNKHECTSFSGVPYSYVLLNRINFERFNLPTLKTMTQAGGRLSVELIEKFYKLSQKNNFKFIVMYGQTEATARISYVPYDKLKTKIGSIGISIPGGKLSIVDQDEIITTPNTEGEIVYNGDNVMMGYAENKNDLEKGDQLNGTLHTGDIGYYDYENYFFVTGRTKRFIKVFGLRVNLDEVEKMIENEFKLFNACSGVDEKLFVLLQTEDLTQNNKVHLKLAEYYKLHKSAIIVKNINKIPVTSSGKKDYKTTSDLFLSEVPKVPI